LFIENLNWYVITEVDRDYVLEPIRNLITGLIVGALSIVLLFLIVGLKLVKRIIASIQCISSDFERVGQQNFMPSTVNSSFTELQNMVSGFNNMVKEIARKQQRLKRAAIVFDNTSEGIIITDSDVNIVSVNQAFSNITGYSEAEVIGRNPSLLQSGQHDSMFYEVMWKSIEETGHWRGEIQNRRKNGEIYTELLSVNSFVSDDNNVIQYVGVFTDISNIKETESKLEYLAHHDPLTDLPNRLLCTARLEHELQLAKRNQQVVAVLFLDLDMFKNINDSLGHVFGDRLLREVTSRLSEHVRNKDTIARLGGDEFIIILGGLDDRSYAGHFAENILSQFMKEFVVDDNEIHVGASIGISIYPDDGKDVETMLRNADTAMYRAKSEGRNNYQFYTSELTSDVSHRLSMEHYLRHALEKNELLIHYQPQYSLLTGGIVAAEALLRWQHPEYGLILPDTFIPIMEETGLIVPIGEWVIDAACKQLASWEQSGCPPLRMAINLSARQFWKPGFASIVHGILMKHGIDPRRLDLELTESIIMRDNQVTIDTLNDFHKMGVELSIDDFGTGYSSLSYLKRFPINRLKIDKTFVHDIVTDDSDADMINSIVALGHCMNLSVLAEGVETEGQLQFLKKIGCDEVQGYYYSKPLAAEDFLKLCKATNCQ
ncbi:MAG: EAL domain-containing protein, partial [Gammaproteobacteria bacterium]|nr:EAL domain-containing protein [Gammaproteobacteria bacterium]